VPRNDGPLTPKLRFKEFEVFWGENALGELFTFKNGLNSDKEKYGSGIKFINVLDIIGESVITYESIIGKVEVTEKELEKNEVIYGDVLFQRSSETREDVGQANVYVDFEKSAVFGGFVIRGRKKIDYNPFFMNFVLKTSSARKEITTRSGGSTRYNVGQESLSQVFVNLPTLPEQQKIASFLSAVDEKIQQLSKKKELLENYKKGVMQQLFSQQLRFKKSNGEAYPDWEEGKFSRFIKLYRGSSPRPIIKFTTTDENGVNWIKIGDTKLSKNYRISSVSEKITKEGSLKSRFVKSGEIILANSMSFGKSYLLQIEGCIYDGWFVLREYGDSFDKEFLLQVLNSDYLQRQYLRLSTGGVVQNISSDIVYSTILFCPILEEQQKIASYLSSIDVKIERVAQQIKKTKVFKKGLLQQMFV
jgi:type I restriction enzyme S subunit